MGGTLDSMWGWFGFFGAVSHSLKMPSTSSHPWSNYGLLQNQSAVQYVISAWTVSFGSPTGRSLARDFDVSLVNAFEDDLIVLSL